MVLAENSEFLQTKHGFSAILHTAVAANEKAEFQHSFQRCVSKLPQQTIAALAEMFDLTAVRLVRLSMTITGNQADAEDAVQGAFSRIAAKPRLLVTADAPWPYLIRVVRNESLRILQKRKRIRSESLQSPVSSEPSAEAMMVYEETSEGVRRILKSLPQSQYEVVILKHWENLTFAEIAEALDLSHNTVASRYRYAIEKLQRHLEPLMK